MKEPYLLAAVALFVIVMLVRLIRGMSLKKHLGAGPPTLPKGADMELGELMADAENGKAREVIRTLSHKAPGAESSELRAAYRCAAGNLALTVLKRPSLAVGLYLKALREEPKCLEAVDKLQEILIAQKRLRRLEWTYWDVLGRLEESEVGGEIWQKCWSGLASIYSMSPRTVRRADAIRKSLQVFAPEDDVDGDRSSLRIVNANATKQQ